MKTEMDIINRIEKIEQRNKKVELDKKWEVSWTRKVSIVFLTYIVVVMYLAIINNDNPLVNALVPSIGYFLSTIAVAWLRKIWQNKTIGHS